MTRDISYDVRVFKTYVYSGKRGKSYTVRWRVEKDHNKKVFRSAAQAETYRGELQAAARKGEAFSASTGEPMAWGRKRLAEVHWYDFVCQYVDMKWTSASAKYRQDIARAMVAAIPPLIVGTPPATDREMRSAMNLWGFNTKRRANAPEPVAARLRWLAANTRPVSHLADPELARYVLEAATSRLDGARAAPDTMRKHRMLLANALDYAVERNLLESNPVRALKWAAPTRSVREVDRRNVINHRQARRLLDAVRSLQPSGPRLVAFFGFMYYSGLRPEEVAVVRVNDLTLPAHPGSTEWGEVHLTGAAPHAGRHWTTDGALRDARALKHRQSGDTRTVPVPPQLVTLVRAHIEAFPPKPDGRIFYGVRSDELPALTYMGVWRAARKAALTERDEATQLAKRPYDLRHACVSTWLNAGLPPTQVAEWAGHSVDVLLRIYAKCVVGQDTTAKRRIAAALIEGLEE